MRSAPAGVRLAAPIDERLASKSSVACSQDAAVRRKAAAAGDTDVPLTKQACPGRRAVLMGAGMLALKSTQNRLMVPLGCVIGTK